MGKDTVIAFRDNFVADDYVEGVPIIRTNDEVLQYEPVTDKCGVVVCILNEEISRNVIAELFELGINAVWFKGLFPAIMQDKKYVLFGKGSIYPSWVERVIGQENILCSLDIWKTKPDIMWDSKYISCSDFAFFIDESIISKELLVIVITAESIKHVVACARYLEEKGYPYIFFEDLVRSRIKDEALEYSRQNVRTNFKYDENNNFYCWRDRFEQAGNIGNYFWQDLWAAKKIYLNTVDVHYDLASRVDGFVAHLLSFGQRVRLIDIRPLDTYVEGVDFVMADATNLDMIEDKSIESLSSLCAIEHFGLGRYGDPIDAEGSFKCFKAIQRKMKKGGLLYISVPIGKERVEFNACRIFYADTVIKIFDKMELLELSATNNGRYEENIEIHKYDNEYEESRTGQIFGLFLFKKVTD